MNSHLFSSKINISVCILVGWQARSVGNFSIWIIGLLSFSLKTSYNPFLSFLRYKPTLLLWECRKLCLCNFSSKWSLWTHFSYNTLNTQQFSLTHNKNVFQGKMSVNVKAEKLTLCIGPIFRSSDRDFGPLCICLICCGGCWLLWNLAIAQ